MLWPCRNHPPSRPSRRAVILTAALVWLATPMPVAVHADVPVGQRCPVLYVFGVQGPDEGAADAASTTDTGALGQLFAPLLAQSADLVQRSYIRYGYRDDGTEIPYEQAIAAAASALGSAAAELISRCPTTAVAAAGYAQGAAAVAQFARDVGAGSGAVGADTVAAVALFANPNRGAEPVLPGRPGQRTPTPPPGTAGAAVAAIDLADTETTGSGIAGAAGIDYGLLSGRVADFCSPGDLSCDSPDSGSALTRTVRNIAAQSDLRDPIAAITTVAQALAATVWKTAVGVVTEDLSGTSLDDLTYEPTQTLGQRLVQASDPSTPIPGVDDALSVLLRLGAIGLNTVVAVAQKVFTPVTVTELATVGMVDPVAALVSLGTKIASAVTDLISPQTALSWVNQAFDAITSTVTDDSELYQLASWTQYSDTSGRHGSYTGTATTVSGQSRMSTAAQWFAAAARDLATAEPALAAPLPAGASSSSVPASAGSTASAPAPASVPTAATTTSRDPVPLSTTVQPPAGAP